MLIKIISGAQTGADRAGLIVAKNMGIQTGGMMPLGFIAQDGNHPEFVQLYGIQQHPSPKYPPRTAFNAKNSDGTIRFATDWSSRGELLTLKMVKQYKKPYFDITVGVGPSPSEAARWIIDNNIGVLNVAGNSERTSPGITEWAIDYLEKVINELKSLKTPNN